MTRMMERVVDPDAGTAPAAPDRRATGWPARPAPPSGSATTCGCYDGSSRSPSPGFAPADNPRFTVYVVVQNPRNGGGGGSVAGPAFRKIMGYAAAAGTPSRRPGRKPPDVPRSTW